MNINNIWISSRAPGQPAQKPNNAAAASATGKSFKQELMRAAASRTDKVELSSAKPSAAGALSHLSSAVKAEVSEGASLEKINRISTQIEQGSYKVDPTELAQIMLSM